MFNIRWWFGDTKKMIKQKFLYLTLLVIISIFSILLLGLNKKNLYTPENIVLKNVKNFESKELYSNQVINFFSLTKEKKITVLNIWSSWCLPCRNEHGHLMKLSGNDSINMIGINYKDKPKNAKSFLNELGNPFETILTDDSGLISIDLGAYGVPETFLINNFDKKIIRKYIGPLNNEILAEIITLSKL